MKRLGCLPPSAVSGEKAATSWVDMPGCGGGKGEVGRGEVNKMETHLPAARKAPDLPTEEGRPLQNLEERSACLALKFSLLPCLWGMVSPQEERIP